MIDWKKIREDFPAAKGRVYLMSAGMSPIPNQVYARIVEEYRRINENGDIFWEEDFISNRKLRARLGSMVGASGDDIAFMGSTSAAMSTVAMSLKKSAKAEFNIVSMMDEFPSSTVPFEYQKFEMRYVEPVHGRYPVDEIMKKVDRKTLAVLTSYVQYSTGFRQDLAKLGRELSRRGVMQIVNSTQGFPFFPIDVEAMGISALAASLHKWGFAGLVGSMFYTSANFRERFPSPTAGWLSVDRGGDLVYAKKNEPFKLLATAERYMEGCINFQVVNSLHASLDYLEGIGFDNIRRRVFELTDHLIGKLAAAGARLISPIENEGERSAILTFDMGNNGEFASYLERRGIYISLRGGNIRVSVNFFNNKEDLDELIAALDDFRKL